MANAITLSRLVLLIIVLLIAYFGGPVLQLANVLLLILMFVGDAIDGPVARARGEETRFGAVLDIACDRAVEYVLWVALADLDAIGLWVPVLFLLRGTVVDGMRGAVSAGDTPFSMMQSRLGRFLVAGRFMRGFYGVIKAVAFCWLFFLLPLPELVPDIWSEWAFWLNGFGLVLVWISAALCVIRGVPVIVEVVQKRDQLQ